MTIASTVKGQAERNDIAVQRQSERECGHTPLRGLNAALFEPTLSEEGASESARFTGGLTPAWL